MAKESLGYVELEWSCPFCGGRNPGRSKVCVHCGAAQPADVKFEKAAEDKIVTDAAALEAAKAGPDIHCAYCGTRNPGTAKTCAQCGADLTEGTKRETGQVVGAKEDKAAMLVCANCGTENEPSALKCKNCAALLKKPEATPRPQPAPVTATRGASAGGPGMIFGILALLLLCGAIAFFFMRGSRTEETRAEVIDAYWERSVIILAPLPSQRNAWRDQVPAGAANVSCTLRERGRSTFQTQNSKQVCGTPYIVDQGSGFGEVVQDCVYIVYDDYCSFTVIALLPLRTVVESGRDANPRWPQPQLASDQQLGQRNETYQVVFDVDGKRFTVPVRDVNEYQRYRIGSEWQVEVNGFGSIVSIQPAD